MKSPSTGASSPLALVTTIASAVICGLVPALQSIATRPDDTLKDTTRGTVNPGRRRMSQVFVVAEVALAVVLLVGAGLLVRSFIRLSNQPIGFQSDHSLEFSLTLPGGALPDEPVGVAVPSHRAR